MLSFNTVFLYFIIYSIIGWCTEMIYCRIVDGKFSDRGFLYGPYCPIYGFGGIIVLIFLAPLKNNPIYLFLSAVILTTTLEYFTSFFMEKIFKAKWWDYSNMPFNLNGRICLLNSLLFGIMGTFIAYFIHPHVENFILKIPDNYIPYIINVLLIIISVDFTFSLTSVTNLKNKLKEIKEVSASIKERQKSKSQDKVYLKQLNELKSKLSEKNSFANNRLIKAFPTLKVDKLNEELNELKEFLENKKIEKKQQKLQMKQAKNQKV